MDCASLSGRNQRHGERACFPEIYCLRNAAQAVAITMRSNQHTSSLPWITSSTCSTPPATTLTPAHTNAYVRHCPFLVDALGRCIRCATRWTRLVLSETARRIGRDPQTPSLVQGILRRRRTLCR